MRRKRVASAGNPSQASNKSPPSRRNAKVGSAEPPRAKVEAHLQSGGAERARRHRSSAAGRRQAGRQDPQDRLLPRPVSGVRRRRNALVITALTDAQAVGKKLKTKVRRAIPSFAVIRGSICKTTKTGELPSQNNAKQLGPLAEGRGERGFQLRL